MNVLLYTTLGCHLCEKALAQLIHLQREGIRMQIESVEIADDDALMDSYGIRIPVVRVEDREIGWPFDIEQLAAFLAGSS